MYHPTHLVLELKVILDTKVALTMRIERRLWRAQAQLEDAEGE